MSSASLVANYSDKLNLTVALIGDSTGSSGRKPKSLTLSSIKFEYFFSSYKNTLFFLTYSSNSFVAFYFKFSTGSTSSILSPSPALNREVTLLKASFGNFLPLTAPIKSGRSKLLSFFTKDINKSY